MRIPQQPVILKGEHVTLRPIKLEDRCSLNEAANDGELSKLWYTAVPSELNMQSYITQAINQQDNKKSLAFTIICSTTGKVLGSSRFCNIDLQNNRLEIGYTWYRKSAQRTQVNTETKLLMLKYAFEELKSVAVEFRTHWMNQRSRNAILRLGAKQDGILRNHRIMDDGSMRDTVVYSIIESEWLAVKRHLKFKIT